MVSIQYKVIYKIVSETFESELKKNTLDLLSFLENNSVNLIRLKGYWENQFYWVAKYHNNCVGYILVNGCGDEKQFSPITIWTDDSDSDWYVNCKISEELSEKALKNVDYCVHCGSCGGGTYKTIFGKGFDNVCRTVMRFTNPNEQEFMVIKELIKIRQKDIQNKFVY